MKAEELMTGDWVMPLRKSVGKPCQVVSIDCGTNTCWIDSDEYSGLLPCSELERIPLTTEILEKNGFSNYAESWYFPSDEKNVRIGFHMYETVLDIKTDNASFYKKIPYGYRSIIKYGDILSVHELQHALRLCGINKEIAIWI